MRYTLVFKHDKNLEVVFPDSAYRFYPFEYMKRENFPTKTIENTSTDSVIYWLRTFEISPELKLNVPVFILNQNDTLTRAGNTAYIQLQEVVKEVQEPLVFKENLTIQTVPEKTNFVTWAIGLIGFFTIFGIVWVMFRARILRRYRIYKLTKNHTYFVNRYNMYIDRFHKSASLQNMEKAIALWKNYLSDLEDNAINSFTTKEIVSFYENDEDVTTALKLFDRAIYGNIVSENVAETLTAFYLLHHFADRRYDFIKEQTRNAAIA